MYTIYKVVIDSTVAKTIRVLTTAVVFAILLLLAYRLRTVIGWLAIGAFLAVVINPAVSRLTRYMPSHRRGLGIVGVIIAGILVLSSLTAIFLPPLVKQGTALVHNWPEITAQFEQNVAQSQEQPYKFIRERSWLNRFQEDKEQIRQGLTTFFGASLKKVGSLLSSLGAIFTILVMMIYLSANGPKYAKGFIKRIPRQHQKDVAELTNKMYRAITGYVNGNLLTSLIAGVAAGAMSVILGLSYPALLGLIVALFDLIPLIGATIGAIIVVFIASFSSIGEAVVMAIFFVIYQHLENFLIVPRVMGRRVDLSTFAVFVSALAGAVLAGFVGALVAIPIGACIQILINYGLDRTSKAV